MIGDIPKGAPLRCRLGRHAGQEEGGTMVFACPRCGGTFWQEADMGALTVEADRRLDLGHDPAEVLTWARSRISRAAGQR